MPRQKTADDRHPDKGSERRKHARVPTGVALRLMSHGKEEAFDLIDLSESGVRIRCHRALAAMTRIQVAMVLPGKRVGASSDVRFETTGVVVWSHKQESIFDTGVFFPEMDERQRGLLRTFVATHA